MEMDIEMVLVERRGLGGFLGGFKMVVFKMNHALSRSRMIALLSKLKGARSGSWNEGWGWSEKIGRMSTSLSWENHFTLSVSWDLFTGSSTGHLRTSKETEEYNARMFR